MIKGISIFKTLWFNIHYFPFRTALHLPVFVYGNVRMVTMKGKVKIEEPIKPGMVRLGFIGLGNRSQSQTVWDNRGIIVIGGKCIVGGVVSL